MNSKSLFIYILLSIVATNAAAQNKKDNALFNKLHKEYVLNEDGSIDYRCQKEIKLLSIRSFDSDYGETFIIYNPDFQSVKINSVYTLKANGDKVECPANAITESLPYSCTDCQRYNGMREMIISHTGLEVGGTIYLDYTIHSTPSTMTQIMENIDFVEFSPVVDYKVTVKTPQNVNLKNRMLNLRLGPTISTDENGNNVYIWQLTNVEQSSSEAYLPTDMVYPKLIISSYKDTQRAYFELVNQDAFRNYSLPECGELLKKLLKDGNNEFENITAIRDYVVDAIHLNNLNIKYTNYKVSEAQTTWNSSCGTALDKAVLLTAMLKEAGYNDAIPVAFISERMHSDEVAPFELITAYAVKVKLNDEDFYLSPVEKNKCSLEFFYNGYMMYPLDANIDHFISKKMVPVDNESIINGNITIENDSTISGEINCSVTSSDIQYNVIIDNEERLSSFVRNIKGTVSDADIDKTKVDFSMKVDDMTLNRMGNTDYFTLIMPKSSRTLNINPSYLYEKRDNPVWCKKIEEQYSYTIELPENCEIVSQLTNQTIEKPFGSLSIEMKTENNSLIINKKLQIKQEFIDYSQYKVFREMIILWGNPSVNEIVIKL